MHLLRKLLFVIGLATIMVAQPAYALGLGESELKSALNQPFQADIKLTNLRGLSRDEIIVRLASQADFDRAGLDRLAFYGQLEFELLLDHPEGPLVRVTTQQPVREPYMNFLVEARWASGRLLREYTFLLDLPTFDDERQAQPVQSATSGRPSPATRQSTTRPSASASSAGEARRGSASSYDGDTYSVSASDTLWEIALRVRPGRDLSVQQTMLAIHRKNPEAFINGNINLLREGQVLRLPSRDEIRNLNPQNAVREVAEHNREWSDRAMGAQLDAGQRASAERQGPRDVSGQVRLAAPNQSGAGDEGQGGGASTDSGAELQADLAAAQEELEKSRRENRELSSRVEELESQIETMESLIEASNEQLRALQASAQQTAQAEEQAQAESRDQPGRDTDSAPVDEPAVDEPRADTDDTTEVAETQEAEQAEPAQAEPAREAVDRSKRVVRSLPKEKTLIDHLMDNLLWIGAGVVVILLGVYAFLRRRQSQEDDFERSEDDDFEPGFDEEGYTEEFDSEPAADDEAGIDLAQDEEAESTDFDQWDDEPSESNDSVEAETGDVVGEADIYIAYGKLDQAEELLLNGLEREPASPEILSKLLEIYAENQNVSAFDQHYSTLLGTDDRSAIQRAGELRDTIPGAGEFDVGALGGNAAGVTPADDDFGSLESSNSDDFDFKLDLEDDTDAVSTDQGAAPDDTELTLDDDFSFDLDDDVDEEPVEPVTTEADLDASSNRYDLSFDETESDSEDDFALDFDLEESDDTVVLQPEGESKTPRDEDTEDMPELDLKLDETLSDSDTSDAGSDDDWNFDLDEGAPAGDLEALDESFAELDEEPAEDKTVVRSRDESSESSVERQEDDLSFDLGDDAEDELTVHESGLDRNATSEDDQEAGQDAFADLDEGLADSNTEMASADSQGGSDDDDFDLDALDAGDLDLSSLDEQMSDLDADLDGEPGAAAAEPAAAEAASEDVDEDQMFEEALSGISTDESRSPEPSPADPDEDMDAELDFLADTDEAATKLDLARAYIDMGDADGARDILEEVRQEGNEQQQQEAQELLGRIES